LGENWVITLRNSWRIPIVSANCVSQNIFRCGGEAAATKNIFLFGPDDIRAALARMPLTAKGDL
jgi:hypothetical protein